MERLTSHQRLYFLVDGLMVVLSLPISYHVYEYLLKRASFPWGSSNYYQTYAFVVASWVISLVVAARYPVRRLTTPLKELRIAIHVTILAGLIFAALSFLLKMHWFSRGFLITDLLVGGVLLIVARLLTRVGLGLIRKSGSDIRTRIIIGDGPSARRYINGTEQNPRLGLKVIGCISDSHHPMGVPYLGALSDLRSILESTSVDGVVIALPLSSPETAIVVNECELFGIQAELMLDSLTTRLTHSEVVDGMGIPRIILPNIPHTEDALALKRITDFLISLAALILLSPLFAVIALIVRLSDGHSIFFKQERMGLHGRTFDMYKFRTMVPNAEDLKQNIAHLNEMSGPVFKVKDDPRVTKAGKWLRQTSLDEIPQLLNVLKGEMSLVGPRPPLPSEVDEYDAEYRRRLSVKPGITGLWQISGRNEVDFDDWMRLDLAYIDSWSYWADWGILFKTIPAVLRRRGAS